jgi:hypothetical protein
MVTAMKPQLAQYELLGRSTSGTGNWETLTSSANVYSLLTAANFAAARTALEMPGVIPVASADGSTSGVAFSSSAAPIRSSRATASAVDQAVFYNSNGAVGSIETDGSSTNFNTSSDKRLKTNVEPIDDAGELIDRMEPVRFDWITDGRVGHGCLAQDLHEVFPAAVRVGDDGPGPEVKDPWQVDYSALVPVLLAEVKALRARVKQLEEE